MSGKAEIQFLDFEPGTGGLRFRIDTGTNNNLRIDLATAGVLFDNTHVAARTPLNFAAGVSGPYPGGAGERVLPPSGWSALDLSSGRLFYRMTTWRDAGLDATRSIELGQGASAPSFSTAPPGVRLLDAFGADWVPDQPADYVIYDSGGAVLDAGS